MAATQIPVAGPDHARLVVRGCGTALAIFTALLVGGVLVIAQWVHAVQRSPGSAVSVPIAGSVVLLSDGVTIVYSDPNALCRTASLAAAWTNARVVLSLSESDGLGSGKCAGFRLGPAQPTPASPLDPAAAILPVDPVVATMPGYPVTVTLTSPLGHRRLVDAFTGKTVPYFDQRTALRLAPAAAGWIPALAWPRRPGCCRDHRVDRGRARHLGHRPGPSATAAGKGGNARPPAIALRAAPGHRQRPGREQANVTRWWRGVRKTPRWVRVGAGCTFAGIVIGFAAARWTSSSVIGHYVSPGSILVSADQRTLTASAGGSCLTGSLDVRENPGTVVVRLHLWPAIMMAPGACAMEVFTARLRAPLGSRQLINGVTGASLPSFDGRGILRPTFLPAGFVHRYDAAFLGGDTVAGASAGCTQVYTQNDSYDESIWISQIAGGHWRAPAGINATPIVVHGVPGLAISGEIEWTENGQLFTIQSMTYAYATLSTSALTAIANSLR